jgi:hypothetical protein
MIGGMTTPNLVPPLPDGAFEAWTRYTGASEQRIRREIDSGTGFLALDFAADAAAERASVRSGAIVIHPMTSVDANGRRLDVPSAMVHHWRGAVLLTGIDVPSLLAALESDAPATGQEDVLRVSVLDRGPDTMTVSLKVRRTKFVTAVYNTEHAIRFHRVSSRRAWSESVATKIAELADVNTERELPLGRDRGFLWRWNSYWRYEQVPEGVIAECESISLSRSAPFGLRSVIGPLVAGVARESMERTLFSIQKYFSAATPELQSNAARVVAGSITAAARNSTTTPASKSVASNRWSESTVTAPRRWAAMSAASALRIQLLVRSRWDAHSADSFCSANHRCSRRVIDVSAAATPSTRMPNL